MLMSDASYILNISPQGQLTLPRALRERLHVRPGSRITATVIDDGKLRISTEPPIASYFGKLAGAWTSDGEGAISAYERNAAQVQRSPQGGALGKKRSWPSGESQVVWPPLSTSTAGPRPCPATRYSIGPSSSRAMVFITSSLPMRSDTQGVRQQTP
jgi:bifunctional DNA-binding transcriptional regulator/antitoxin component of YhaV-PrlF toxin-antitoxin module